MKPEFSPLAQQEIANIAQSILGLRTLETRNSDSLDFHQHAVWSVKEALEAAYLAGMVHHMR